MRTHETAYAIKLWNRGHWRDYIFSQLMLFTAALFLVFFISIGLGVQKVLDRFMSRDLPAEQVRVVPPGIQAGFFQSELGGLEVTETLRESIQSLPQVSRIDPQIYAHVPAYLEGLLGGQPYYTDITVEGVTGEFLGDSVLAGIDWSYDLADSATRFLPIVLSENLLLLYNAGYAEANELVGLTPEGVIGIECEVTMGRSSIASVTHRPVSVRARIVAVSDNLALFALAVPIEFVDDMNTLFLPERERSYSALMVTAQRAEDVPEIVRAVEALGLRAETRRGIAQKAELLVSIVTAALSALALAILVSAVTSAVHTLIADIRNRKFAIGVLVALGTPWEKLAAVFSFQILLMSCVSLVLGGLGGTLVAWGVSEALLSLSTVLRAALDSLAVFPAGWMAAGLVVVLSVSTGLAYLSFRKLLGQPVADLLRR